MSGISFREPDPHDRSKLLCWVVVQLPIALVAKLDENGKVNAAPATQRNTFELTRESHTQWLARNGTVATLDGT